MNIPANLKYSKDHEWIRVEGDEAYVGITDFAQSQLGDIVFVDVTTEGEFRVLSLTASNRRITAFVSSPPYSSMPWRKAKPIRSSSAIPPSAAV